MNRSRSLEHIEVPLVLPTKGLTESLNEEIDQDCIIRIMQDCIMQDCIIRIHIYTYTRTLYVFPIGADLPRLMIDARIE